VYILKNVQLMHRFAAAFLKRLRANAFDAMQVQKICWHWWEWRHFRLESDDHVIATPLTSSTTRPVSMRRCRK